MKRKSNWLKNLLQWGTLAAIVGFVVYGLTLGEKPADVEAYCPFGGLQALGSYLVNNSLACTMSMTQIMVGVMLAVGVILFSKLFCGYLCPLGTVSEWMGRGGKKLKVSVEIRPGSIADRLLRAVKYALLFYVFYMSASSSELFCKNFDPYYAVATGFKGEITVWMTVISVALLFLGSFFVKMFWCKYICPLGALSNIFKFTLTFAGIVILLWALGLLGVASAWVWALGAACVIGYLWEMIYLKSKVFPLLRIVRDEATCTKCDVCRRKSTARSAERASRPAPKIRCRSAANARCAGCPASWPSRSSARRCGSAATGNFRPSTRSGANTSRSKACRPTKSRDSPR